MATRSIEDRLDDLRAGLDRLQADLLRQAETAGRRGSAAAEAVMDRAEDAADAAGSLADGTRSRIGELAAASRRLIDSAESGLGEARETVRVVADRARHAVVDAASAADAGSRRTLGTVRGFVRERPVTSIMVAIAAGLVAARLFERD